MINGLTVLAVIPARGGSKRCPRKNILPFRGKPLLQWTVEAAKACSHIDHIVLSSDDPEILALGVLLDVHSVERPGYLAHDTAKSEDTLRHTLAWYPHDYVVLLQPTSPYRLASDIERCLQIAVRERQPVVSYSQSVIKHGGKNGAVYVCKSEWLKTNDFSNPDHYHYLMPDERSLDIDFPKEFEIGEIRTS